MYDHLLSVLGRAHADLTEALAVADELIRDKCLEGETRNLGQMIGYLGSVERQVRRRAMDTRSTFPAAPP
jgi:hypothetical protein